MKIGKIAWSGRLVAVQPRIRLVRSFDQRYHVYLGYVLRVDGVAGSDSGEFLIAVGKGSHEKNHFYVGIELSGFSVPIDDPKLETASLYKTSGIRIMEQADSETMSIPPFHGVPPTLETYRMRGHRRLEATTYASKCSTCIWGCMMPVEMIIDQWNPTRKKYRSETFCYGPKRCPTYRAGATRKVPGRRGMTWEEENWVDEDAVSHRGQDD